MIKFFLKQLMAGALVAATVQTAMAETTLKIGFLRGPTDMALARENGSLEKALAEKGIRLEWAGPFSAAAPAYEALNAGSIDMTTGSSTAFITAISAGLPLIFFAAQPMPAEGEGIVVREDSPIKTLADLRGKNVAVNKGGTGEYLLSRALENAGIDESEVKKSWLSPSDTGTAFAGGHVDAWATWDPFLTLARKTLNGRLLINGRDLGSENAAGYFVSQRWYHAHPEVLQIVWQVLQQQNAWAKAHPREAGKIWAKQMGQSGEGVSDLLGEVNTVPITVVDAEARAHLKHIADWYLAKGLIPAIPDIDAHTVELKTQ